MKNLSCTSGLRLILSVLFSSAALLAAAQDVRILPAVTRSYAITQATVIQGPGRKIESATVVIKDGLITAVGKNVPIPSDAVVIKGDSLYVYAGFIDGLSHAGVRSRDDGPKEKQKDPGNPAAEAAGITPYQDARSYLNPFDKSIEEWRAIGFTMAHAVPYGGMLPGNSALLFMKGGPSGIVTDKMIAVPRSALYSELVPAERMYPNTILGVMAKWKELYRQAALAKSYAAMYASNKSGLEVPAADRILEAFYPVIDKQVPVLFKAEKNLDVQRILNLKTQLSFNLIIAEVKEGWDLIPKLKSADVKVFLSLELPEEKKPDEKADKEKKKDEMAIVPDSVERKALEKRKADFIALYVSQASAFQKAGMIFGFSGLSAKPKDVQTNVRRMIKAGLTEDGALAALTSNASQLLGLSDRLGTIDQGKIANLVVSHKPYFEEKSNVRYVFVEGKLYKIESPQPEKPAGEKKVEKP